jgi:hypothetical protein
MAATHSPLLLPIHNRPLAAVGPADVEPWPSPPTSTCSNCVNMTDDMLDEDFDSSLATSRDMSDQHDSDFVDHDMEKQAMEEEDCTPREMQSSAASASNDFANNVFPLFKLPAELRNLVYEELLLSDSAFRLGHQGPYSHESRKRLYPQILCASKTLYTEASVILYGANAFYLGMYYTLHRSSPIKKLTKISGRIGHKPTYSASFKSSIGAHNAAKIRTLVAHSTSPARLTQSWVRNWILSFGLDASRLRVLAISFSNLEMSEPLRALHTHTLGSTLTTIMLAPNGHAFAAGNASGLGHGGDALQLQHGGADSSSGAGDASGLFDISAMTGSTSGSGGGIMFDRDGKQIKKLVLPESDFDVCARRMAPWLERAGKRDVLRWVVLKNTDLRAGDQWLLYVSPTTMNQARLLDRDRWTTTF